jgi:hypothetical protein
LVRTPRYTIKLASFGLDETKQREFDLGDLAFFKATTITVSVHFLDEHSWWHFHRLSPSEKTAKYVAEFKLRDLDRIVSVLKYRVSTAAGEELFQSDKLLGDYIWSGAVLRNGWSQVETYDPANASTFIRRGDHLKLWFSYSGDPSLTNRADLVIVCRSE